MSIMEQQQAQYGWDAREVVREIDDRPHLLVRVEVRGGHFPQRAAIPFVRIVGPRGGTSSVFADVTEDERGMRGYFPTDLPARGTVEFGYGDQVVGRVAGDFDPERVRRLERERLPRDVVEVSTEFLRSHRH